MQGTAARSGGYVIIEQAPQTPQRSAHKTLPCAARRTIAKTAMTKKKGATGCSHEILENWKDQGETSPAKPTSQGNASTPELPGSFEVGTSRISARAIAKSPAQLSATQTADKERNPARDVPNTCVQATIGAVHVMGKEPPPWPFEIKGQN